MTITNALANEGFITSVFLLILFFGMVCWALALQIWVFGNAARFPHTAARDTAAGWRIARYIFPLEAFLLALLVVACVLMSQVSS